MHDLSALELAAALRARELSAVEALEHYLARIDRLDRGPGSLGAFVTVTAERARRQAVTADRVLAGWDGTAPLPPLLGVPLPVKDLVPVAGVRWTRGSAAYADEVADVTDGVVRRLRAAGTVLLGTTNTSELGLSCYTENTVAPPARTPWDPDRSAGGSSGGAAAAVAAGLAPAAHGNDGGGSVRIPASACGLVGLKPSRGRVGPGPLFGDVSGLVTHGPLTRTVADAAALLDAMAGPWPGDPLPPAPPPPGGTFLPHTARPPGRLRVAWHTRPVLADAPVHPEVAAAVAAVRDLLADLGHRVEEVAPPFGPEVVPAFEVVWAALSTLAPVPPDREELLLPLTRWLRQRGRAVPASGYLAALTTMQLVGRAAVVATRAYDAVLCPTLAAPPAPVGGLRDDADPAADFAAQKAFSPYCAAYNVSGQPAVQLPLYRSATGLPVGVQLAGRPGAEHVLLALAAQLEQARPWRGFTPPCW